MEAATHAYAAQRPEFNLLTNNCARFACAMVAACASPSAGVVLADVDAAAADATPNATAQPASAQNSTRAEQRLAADGCNPDSCSEHLMFDGPAGQPGCGMVDVPLEERQRSRPFGFPAFGMGRARAHMLLAVPPQTQPLRGAASQRVLGPPHLMMQPYKPFAFAGAWPPTMY